MPAGIDQIVLDLTGGLSFVFVAMAYGERDDVFLRIKTAVEQIPGLVCIRADHAKAGAFNLLDKIHLLIRRADLVIGDITPTRKHPGVSPNVFYEIGYAKALNKPLLLILEEGKKTPVDLQGLETVRYGNGRDSFEKFSADLRLQLAANLTSRTALLSDMLLANAPCPSYVVASPKNPTTRGRQPSDVRNRRTFGDNLGILGLISAFGAMRGENSDVHLISAKFHALSLSQSEANLYLIGSSKSNPMTAEVMAEVQKESSLRFRLDAAPGQEPHGDYTVALYRRQGRTEKVVRCPTKMMKIGGNDVYATDIGIILRAPHPYFRHRIVMVMAGPHNVGTGAACLAVTNSSLIDQIRAKLRDDSSFRDKRRTIYALVKGTINRRDGHLYPEGVKILEAGEMDV